MAQDAIARGGLVKDLNDLDRILVILGIAGDL